MFLFNHRHLLLAALAMMTISSCSTMSTSSAPENTTNSEAPAPYTLQTADQLSQMKTQIMSLQSQVTTLQNQLNDLRQQQSTLSRYLNVHIQPARVNPIKNTGNSDTTDEARRLYNAGLYAQSIRLLKNADSGSNGSKLAQERMWLLLQSHMRLNNCESVINIGKRFSNLFPQNSQTPNALYLVAQCQTHLQQQDIARTTYQRIISNYPTSNAANKAKHQLKK